MIKQTDISSCRCIGRTFVLWLFSFEFEPPKTYGSVKDKVLQKLKMNVGCCQNLNLNVVYLDLLDNLY